MNILVLSELIFPQGSGAELATSLWCDLLSKAGANIRIITSGSGGEHQKTKTSRIETLRLPLFAGRGKYSTLLRSDVFTSSVMRSSIDWSDVVYIPRFWYSAIPIVRRRKKPVITHMHDYYAVCPLSTIFFISAAISSLTNGFLDIYNL